MARKKELITGSMLEPMPSSTLSDEEILRNMDEAIKLLAPLIRPLSVTVDLDIVKDFGLALNTLASLYGRVDNELRNLKEN